MILRLFSDLPKFKSMSFHRGLNIVLADKSAGATDRQTRNGAGKTSLIELVQFLLGASCPTESIFRLPELVDHDFGMELILGGQTIRVLRSGSQPAKVFVEGDTSLWPVQPKQDRETGNPYVSADNWKRILGRFMFGLSDGTDDDSFHPTFRSLFGYFARRQLDGGFDSPFDIVRKQQTWVPQVAISYLLDLDWTIPQSWQAVRDREQKLEVLKRAAKDGALGAMIGKAAELRTQVTLGDDRCRRLRQQVRSFHVLPEYHELERDASSLTRRLNDLANENSLDRQLKADLETALTSEMPPAVVRLQELYQEAGVTLPDTVLRRFDDVRRFHDSVIANRRLYLEQELTDIRQRVTGRDSEKEIADKRRGEVLNILQTHGALDQFSLLQTELSRLEAETESFRQRLQTAEALETGKTELEMERGRLQARLRQDYQEQQDRIARAVLIFGELSQALYESPGFFTISPEENGPRFDVKIHAAKSKGINSMQIFCFDLMLLKLLAERQAGPGFLIHDSHLFDGVDERQVAKALELGAKTVEKHGWQYIVTLNSDALPSGFSRREAVIPTRLTDATEDGGLLGVRFS